MTEAQIAYMLSKIPAARFAEVEEIAALACWLGTEEGGFSTGGGAAARGGPAARARAPPRGGRARGARLRARHGGVQLLDRRRVRRFGRPRHLLTPCSTRSGQPA